jgi:hypothetical protein
MGILVRQDEKRSELSDRIASELRERQKQAAAGPKPELDDQSKDASMLQNLHETRTAGVVITILVLVTIVVGIYLLAT